MHLRKLLGWKPASIYIHRWAGMAFSLVFAVWFVSGVVMMYVRMPVLSAVERLGHLAPLDLSSARVSPADAARVHHVPADGLEIEMYYDGRPVYRFAGGTRVYADTGEEVPGRDREAAIALVRRWVPPAFAGTVRYDAYLLDSDQWTLYTAQRRSVPLHRITVGDPAGTVYYVSERTGEPVMKTDRRSRFWGYVGAVLHWTYFTALRRRGELWSFSVAWASLAGMVMTLLGLLVGIVRLRLRKYRLPAGPSHSPYVGWMYWHHYAGLIFGVATVTWAFSGAMSLGRPWDLGNRAATAAQRTAVAGSPLDPEVLTLPRLRAAITAFTPVFSPKTVRVRQFRGEAYVIGEPPPEPWSYEHEIGADEERREPKRPHLIVSLTAPQRGTFSRFPDDRMWDVAKAAMPDVPVSDAAWLRDYDAYYYDKNRLRPLPVLRVRYADDVATWLYLDPAYGTMTRIESSARWSRWLYQGLHSLDFPFLRFRRPLWDAVVILLSAGGLALSLTTVVPAFRRLQRHARRPLLTRSLSRYRGNGSGKVVAERMHHGSR